MEVNMVYKKLVMNVNEFKKRKSKIEKYFAIRWFKKSKKLVNVYLSKHVKLF